MSEREPITAELRRWLRDCCHPYNVDEHGTRTEPTWEGVCDRCDAIDAVHAALERENAELRERLAVLDNERENMHDGWVRLPVDADGEVIHIGDEMEYGRAHGRVIALMLSNYPKKWGGGLHWGIQLEGEQAPTALDLMFHHYHAPTVEDVLFEFARFWSDEELTDIEHLQPHAAQTIAEYAAKLRLAGDAE